MRGSMRYRLTSALSLVLMLLAGCPSTPSNPTAPDSTGPSFADVTVRLESTVAPTVRGEFNITTDDVIREGVPPGYSMRLIALVGDPESGISNTTIESNITWQCQAGLRSEIIGIVESVPVTFTSFAQPSTPVTPLQINVTANPLAQTGCDRGEPGKGPINFRGFVRVAATNGQGAVMKSKTYIFDFGDAGVLETPYMTECRSQGVPIPPNWSVNTNKWVQHGNLVNSNLLQPGSDAFVWSYTDPNIRGACIALPRGSGGARGGLAGIICQNAETAAACFWDSRWRDDADPLREMPAINWSQSTLIISQLKDATNITESDSGVCTTCHRGNNVFLISPDHPAWSSVMRGQLPTTPGSKFTTRILGSTDMQGGHPRYVPLSGQRPGWGNTFKAGGCGGACHENPDLAFSRLPTMPPTCATNGDAENCYR
jgi:hypothetical protein